MGRRQLLAAQSSSSSAEDADDDELCPAALFPRRPFAAVDVVARFCAAGVSNTQLLSTTPQ